MNDPTAKMYANLTPAELGVLAVKYLVASDDLELGRIKNACPRKTYRMHDASYLDAIESFIRMSNAWGLLYWQYQYDRMKYALRMAIAFNRGMETPQKEEAFHGRRDAVHYAESCLLAMDVALDEACSERGFDAADARLLVGAKIFTPLKSNNGVPDVEILATVKELLRGILANQRSS